MSAGYYRVGQYYYDTAGKVLWRCKVAGDKTSSVWDQVSASGGGVTLEFFQIVSDAGDYWVCNKNGGSALAFYNVTKPYNIRAGSHAIGSQVINSITYTYTYSTILDGSGGTIAYKRKVSGSDGSLSYDYCVPPGCFDTVSTGGNDIITAIQGADDTSGLAPDTVITAVINAGGTGYVVNDILTLVGGTGTAATIKVLSVGTGGVITNMQMATPGSYTVDPSATGCTVTGGSGTGATFNLTFGGQWLDINRAGRAWAYSPYN